MKILYIILLFIPHYIQILLFVTQSIGSVYRYMELNDSYFVLIVYFHAFMDFELCKKTNDIINDIVVLFIVTFHYVIHLIIYDLHTK